MKAEVGCTWKGGMAFETIMDGHKIVIDATPEVGGKNLGPRPKPFMLLSLGGCTGMDVISILNKMGQKVSWFNVRVEAEQTEEHPKHYSSFHIIYEFKNSDDAKEMKRLDNEVHETYLAFVNEFKKKDWTHE